MERSIVGERSNRSLWVYEIGLLVGLTLAAAFITRFNPVETWASVLTDRFGSMRSAFLWV
ncbi:hypothetical protein C7E12_05600 [Stenotrophomonas maltophilia]|nr:hypothetical protein C7E12_05600 [Stenotrophomonas maltophilia]